MTTHIPHRDYFFGFSLLSVAAAQAKLFTDTQVLLGFFLLPCFTQLYASQSKQTMAAIGFYFPLLCVTLGRMAAQSVYGGPVPSS